MFRRVLQTRLYCPSLMGSDRHTLESDTVWQAVDEALTVDWSSRRREIGRVYFDLENCYEWKENPC
eukprot:scaffold1409_cov212-Cylindrotheca_fusiformis.AAC.2